MVKKKKYIKIKIRCYTLNYKIHKKKISLGEYSSLRKKKRRKKENHFNLGNHKKNTWG